MCFCTFLYFQLDNIHELSADVHIDDFHVGSSDAYSETEEYDAEDEDYDLTHYDGVEVHSQCFASSAI